MIAALSGCDNGLQPPTIEEEVQPTGAIEGTITYSGEWPSEDSLRQAYFVPLDFIPDSASAIVSRFIAGNLITSEQLERYVDSDTFFVGELPNGAYIYNAIANQFGPNIFSDWHALGVYTENDGVIIVQGDTTEISIHVDFDNLPPFPPE